MIDLVSTIATDNLTANAKPILTGTGEPNSTVTVTIDPDNNPATENITYSVTTNASGAWSLDLASATPSSGTLPSAGLPNGTVGLTVSSTDAAGNTATASSTFVVDTAASLEIRSIAGETQNPEASDADNYATVTAEDKTAGFTISGVTSNVETGREVTVEVLNAAGTVVGTQRNGCSRWQLDSQRPGRRRMDHRRPEL